jgi:2-methylcitrate dehydratase PrpD
MSAPFCVAMAIKDREATLAGLHRTDDPVVRELVARTEVIADERLPPLASRIELTTTTGARHVRELIPDDTTYGWDWDGVLKNSRRLHTEMEISEAAFERLAESIRDLPDLDSVDPLLRVSVA